MAQAPAQAELRKLQEQLTQQLQQQVYFAELWSGFEEGSYLRRVYVCITQL